MFETPEIKHSQHFIWVSVDRELICLVERYEGIRTYWRRGYRVSLWNLVTGECITEPFITTSPLNAECEVYRLTDGGDGTGFSPDLLELEVD